jgi:transcriptional regulator with XRE-family HTH domain
VTLDQHIGQSIRRRRRMMDMTQACLSELCGVSFQTVHKWETGQNRISAAQLWKLSRALLVPVSFFYEGLEMEVAA